MRGRDCGTVTAARTNAVEAEIPIRIAGLETLRGVLPVGMAYHEKSGWLLVAEAGINAVGVIDTREGRLIGHIPVGWFPARVEMDGDTVFVTNIRGIGTGPNGYGVRSGAVVAGTVRQGTLSIFPLPQREELAGLTGFVMEANGFVERAAAPPLPAGIRHVVLIVKENRTYDEVLGDEMEDRK